MKNMKKYLAGLGVASFVIGMMTPAHAAFTSKPPLATLTATATTGGTPVIAILSAVIKNISDNAPAQTIGCSKTAPGWKVSHKKVIRITYITHTSAGAQHYT